MCWLVGIILAWVMCGCVSLYLTAGRWQTQHAANPNDVWWIAALGPVYLVWLLIAYLYGID